MGAHITYLGRRAAPQVRPQVSRIARTDLLVRRRLEAIHLRHRASPSFVALRRELYLYLTRAMDYFDRSRLRRRAGERLSTPTRSASSRSPVTGCFRPRTRAPSHALNAGSARVSFAEVVTDRGHDAFCDERNCSRSCALPRQRRRSARIEAEDMMLLRPKRDLTMVEAARAPGGARVDHLSSPRWSSRSHACSTSAAATASCRACSNSAASTGAASISARGRE